MRPLADRSIRKAVSRIDKGLSIQFLSPPDRFAVLHADQLPCHPDEYADLVAREVQGQAALNGYLWDLADCRDAAVKAVHDSTIVFYVTEPDGSFRQPGWQDVEKLQRMDQYRRELSLGDWKRMHQAKVDELRKARERSTDAIYDSIKRDKVLARCISDVLWGMKPLRSVYVVKPPEVPSAPPIG